VALRVFSIAQKDLKIYLRQRKTLALMILTPVLIMVIVGSVFSGGAERGLKNVKLAVSGGQTPEGARILESLSRGGMFTIEELETTPSEMEALVRGGAYSAGMILPANQSVPLRLFLDDSKFQVAPVISTVFLTVTEKVSFEITLAFMEELWENLQQMEGQMDPLSREVRMVNATISEISRDVEQIEGSMSALNLSGLRISIGEMERALDEMEAELNQSRKDLNHTREEMVRLNSTVGEIHVESSELRDEIRGVVESINATDQALLEIQKDLQNVYDGTCVNRTAFDPQCVSLEQTLKQVNSTRDLLHQRTGRITDFYRNLNAVAEGSADLQRTLGEIDGRLERMDRSMASYLARVSDLREEIRPIDEAISELEGISQRTSATFQEVSRLSLEINRNADELVAALEESKKTLGEVVAKPPIAVISPIDLEKFGVFAERSYLDFLLPSIIGIVLMFVCLLLASITIVQEKGNGTLLRTLLAPIHLHELLLGKMIALLPIALLQAVILVGIARFVYGIEVPLENVTPLVEGVLIYSASFSAIGMALATFADSENTAMLSSLVLSVPMLFLNGTFFPFEMMPPGMATVGRALPISLGIDLFQGILLYGRGIPPGTASALGAYLLGAYGVAYIQMRRLAVD
jgi:ABC-type multidrug transport system permease subunit/prefoldin subunit 5